MAQAQPCMPRNWVFAELAPVLDVEVSIQAASAAIVDWGEAPRRDGAIRAIVERCGEVFGEAFGGRVEHVRHGAFSHQGITVHLNIAAPATDELDRIVARDLEHLRRSLRTSLQAHFGWEQAAVSVQIETDPVYEARRGRFPAPRYGASTEIGVWQPPGGSNAIAPVIVTMPAHTDPYCAHCGAHRHHTRGSAAVAGLLGVFAAFAFAGLVALMIGPLTVQLARLYADQRTAETTLAVRDQEISSLRHENRSLHDAVSRLASRRGQPAMRSDQPTRALPDTGPAIALAPPSSTLRLPAAASSPGAEAP